MGKKSISTYSRHIIMMLLRCVSLFISSTLVTALREECSSWTYYTLDSPHRNVATPEDTYPCGDQWWCTDITGYDNTAPDWSMGGVWGDQPSWYRVVPPAGTRLLSQAPGEKMCGTMASGWVEGEHPQVEGDTVDRVVYFDFDDNNKYDAAPVKITHCGDYFVYFLEEAPAWDFGYCTTD